MHPGIVILTVGGLAAWWAARQQAKAAGADSDPVADLLTGQGLAGGTGAGQRSPVTIEKIGADTIIPDASAEFAELRSFGGQVLSQGGYGRIETPDYIWEIESGNNGTSTPPTTPPTPIPVHTSTVLDVNGRYVPLSSFYIGSFRGWRTPPGMTQIYGWLDVYFPAQPGYVAQLVWRDVITNTYDPKRGWQTSFAQAPTIGYSLAGALATPPWMEILLYNGQPYEIPNILYKPTGDDDSETGLNLLRSALAGIDCKIWWKDPSGDLIQMT